jgi:hypothetical protein
MCDSNTNFDKLLANLTSAVSYSFRKDATSPGVLVSTLKDGSFYASVVRYGNQFPKGKEVVCKAKGSDLVAVLTALANEFLGLAPQNKNPLDLLRECL